MNIARRHEIKQRRTTTNNTTLYSVNEITNKKT